MAVILAALVWIAASGAGCTNTRALFTRPQLYTYDRHAVLGLDPEQEQIFMAAYIRAFSARPVTFVERGRLRDILGEQDLLHGRLNDRTRARIKQILGVEALILCEYYSSDTSTQKKLRVRIVNSETGAIDGSVLIEAPGNFESHARMAAEAIKADLLRGPRRDSSAEPST